SSVVSTKLRNSGATGINNDVTALLIVFPFSGKDVIVIFCNPCLAGFRLFSLVEIYQISLLTTGSQRVKRPIQRLVIVKQALKFLGNRIFAHLLQCNLFSSLFILDGFRNVVEDNRPKFYDILHACKANLPGRLHMVGLPDQNAMIILQQNAFMKEQGAILFEAMNQYNIFPLTGIAWMHPLEVL